MSKHWISITSQKNLACGNNQINYFCELDISAWLLKVRKYWANLFNGAFPWNETTEQRLNFSPRLNCSVELCAYTNFELDARWSRSKFSHSFVRISCRLSLAWKSLEINSFETAARERLKGKTNGKNMTEFPKSS